jgi:hypothetical protein
MALWGKIDGGALTGTVDVTSANNEIVGTGTAFQSELAVEQVITVGANSFVVKAINSDTNITVSPVPAATVANTAATEMESPKYLDDTVAVQDTSLVTTTEAKDANNRVIGIKTPGWTTYNEYTDANGNTRRRIETLVPLKS